MSDDFVEGEYDEQGIVSAGGLAETFNPNGFFDGDVNATTAKIAVGKLKSIEDMLKAAEQYGQYAVQFCLLEAQTFIRIAEVDGAEAKLTGAKQRLVRWIRGKSSDELSAILEEVARGMRITSIEKRDNTSNPSREERVISEMKRIQNGVVNEFKRTGRTRLNREVFYESWSIDGKPDKRTVDAYTEGTRDLLLKSGGRGLGDELGTYMSPNKCKREDVGMMVQNRINSIFNDIKCLANICKEKDFYVSEENLHLLHEAIDSLGDDGE